MSPWVYIILGVIGVALSGLLADYGRRALQKQDQAEAEEKKAALEQPTFTEKFRICVSHIRWDGVIVYPGDARRSSA
jgi:uncharacterized membrane-anchored protein YhcB (DUF1043 family)